MNRPASRQKPPGNAPAPDRASLLRMYATMRLIRTFEDRVHRLVSEGKIVGAAHLSAGEEAVAVGVMSALRPDDMIGSTHRPHGHCIAKGMDLKGIVAELLGRATGVCKGKGGSMHLADPGVGMLGSAPIVGAGIPIMTGAALSAKYRASGQVAVCFFGDGATNQGTFHEALNLAAVLELPCIYVCENNLYADTTSIDFAMRVENVADRAAAYGIPATIVDGQNVVEVYRAAKAIVERARAQGTPHLLEAKTYRYYGHYEGDNQKYRTKEEIETYRRRDPLKIFAEEIAPAAGIGEGDLQAADTRALEQFDEALQFAEASPYPDLGECLSDVFVQQ